VNDVADDETGEVAATTGADDWKPVGGAPPKEPGWYPTRTSPNDQAYWDGRQWAGQRRWTAGKGWVSTGDAPAGVPVPAGSLDPPRLSANPYVQSVAAESRVSGTTRARRMPTGDSAMSLGLLLLFASGILLMVGSVTTWIHANVAFTQQFNLSASVNGLNPGIAQLIGIDGWATFICGVVVVALACALMASEDSSLRLLCLVAGLTSAGFAIFDLVRILQKVNQSSLHGSAGVGVGIYLVAAGGVIAGLVSLSRMRL
jgi:hypothetical protein